MTECERLIKSGLLKPEFLQEEMRCGYQIDSKMKKLWALQIDLMKQIESICKKYNLNCYLIGGGCIGAIRHKGCIPWDDDIDVALRRKDYNVFIEKAQQELKQPYFLQTPITDPPFYKPFIIMRNSNGTCICTGDRKLTCNNGILIHVFPLDGYKDNLECRLFKLISHYKNAIAVRSHIALNAGNRKIQHKIIQLVKCIVFPLGLKHYYIKFNQKCTKLSKKYTDKIGIQYTHFDNSYCTWDASHFESTIDMPFEYTTLPVPVGYHEVLTSFYGDYMKFPPEEKRLNKHAFVIEPDVPYKQYCHEHYGTQY